VYVFQDDQAVINAFAWSPDSARIASADAVGQVQVWDAATGGQRSTYGAVAGNVFYISGGVNTLAWSPNGRYLASGSDTNLVEVWALGTPTPVFSYSEQADIVSAIAWSPNSQRIASAADDGTVQVWDALTGEQEQTYQLL
jgi:tricorn protease-like protein